MNSTETQQGIKKKKTFLQAVKAATGILLLSFKLHPI